ncbi:hypothetical protein JCM11641_002116 [Rhodosporidiobolus odoratus]
MLNVPPSPATTSTKDTLLDRLWPLSRFIGYRPPPAQPKEGQQGGWMDHVLPAEGREKQRRKRGGEVGLDSRSRNGEGDGGDEEGSGGDKEQEEQEPSLGSKVGTKASDLLLTLIGSFGGTAFLALLSRAPFLFSRSAPLVIGSFGAEAVLLYAAPTVALAQPRHVIVGNTVSAIVGVAIAKGFGHLDGFMVGGITGYNWAAASIALSLALFVMQLLEVTHPPGGATALLAVTIPQISQLGWWYVPDVIVSSLIMLVWALLVNNIGGRKYPNEWFWPKKYILV